MRASVWWKNFVHTKSNINNCNCIFIVELLLYIRRICFVYLHLHTPLASSFHLRPSFHRSVEPCSCKVRLNGVVKWLGGGNGKVRGPCKLQAGAAIGNNPKHYCHSSFSSRFGFGCHIPSTVCSFFSSLLTFSFNHNHNSFNHYDSDRRLQMFDFCAFIDCIPLPASFENLHAAYFIRLRIGNWECEEQWSCASFRAKENCFWSMWMDERTYCAVLSLSIQWSMDLFVC